MISDYDRAHMQEILDGHGTWFTAELLRLCAHADAENLAWLQLAFPEVVQAYLEWRSGVVA